MDAILNQILLTYGLPAVVVVVVGYYSIKKLIDRSVEGDIERLKNELRGQTDSDLIRLQSILDENTKRKEIGFSTFREKQVEVISSLYEKISYLELGARFVIIEIDFEPENNERRGEELSKLLDDFEFYYYSKKIYLPEETCRIIDDYFKHIMMGTAIKHISSKATLKEPEVTKQNLKAIREKLPVIKGRLDSDLRKIMGGE